MKFECLLPEGFAWTQRNFTGLNQVGDKFSIGSIISHYQLLSWAFILSSTNILNTKKFKYEQFVQDGFPKWPAEFWIQKKKKKWVFIQNMNLKPAQLHVLVFTLLCPSSCSLENSLEHESLRCTSGIEHVKYIKLVFFFFCSLEDSFVC